jgi:accessory gene regulator protein AgrB
MKYLAEKITNYIVKSGVISEKLYAAYQYGFQIGLEMLSCFLVCFGIAIHLHMTLQFWVFTGAFMLLRTYAGGLHLNSYLGCFICSVVVQTFVLLIDSQYTVQFPLVWGIILISSILILKNAPVENINRELDKKEKWHCKKITKKVLVCIVIFTCGCTAIHLTKIVSLIALTVLCVLIFQYIGMIKYNIEKKRRE